MTDDLTRENQEEAVCSITHLHDVFAVVKLERIPSQGVAD